MCCTFCSTPEFAAPVKDLVHTVPTAADFLEQLRWAAVSEAVNGGIDLLLRNSGTSKTKMAAIWACERHVLPDRTVSGDVAEWSKALPC